MEPPEMMADDSLVDRMCIVSRVVKPESELVRFALAPDGTVVPDLKRKLPGRGVWVSLDRKVLGEALQRKLFARGFGADAKTGPELADVVGSLLRKDVLASLSLSRRAGLALSGFMKVEEALVRGNVRVLFHGAGASADGSQKLNRKAAGNTVILDLLSSDELDLAFGRSNVVHAAMINGSLTEKLLDSARRLAQYEGLNIAGLGI